MGLFTYLVPTKKSLATHLEEKKPAVEINPLQQLNISSNISLATSSRVTLDDGQRSVDDIKHQVILNYLWQKQRGLMWIADTSGRLEGVMIRKNKHEYLYRPPALGSSQFARAMSLLNVQVRRNALQKRDGRGKFTELGGHDNQFQCYRAIFDLVTRRNRCPTDQRPPYPNSSFPR